jgi:putative cardiolipin synthase
MIIRRIRKFCLVLASIGLGLGLLSSCATQRPQILKGRPQTTLAPPVEQTSGTSLAQVVDPAVAAHPGKSGYRLLDLGRDAFEARLALIEAAEKTLDAQYYVWRADATGTVLLERLMAAADRGVRVRLLVDDMLYGRDDLKVASLCNHENVEIRLYNALDADVTNSIARIWDLVSNFGDLNHRMHNKFMIADNRMVITGGRNVGDKYHGVNRKLVFRDLDVLACGPVVQQASGAFDAYWNSERSLPVEGRLRDFLSFRPDHGEHERLIRQVDEYGRNEQFPLPVKYSRDQALALLRPTGGNSPAPIFWCPSRLVVDTTAKGDLLANGRGSLVAEEIEKIAGSAQQEVVLESAYLVPRERMMAQIDVVRGRGVNVRTLTNSMASTNHVYVHSFYVKGREKMIDQGVEIYETKVDAESLNVHSAFPEEADYGLHAKTLVVDRKTSFVGTFNLDPRSAKWNSEAGVVIESREFAEHLLEKLSRDFEPANSWRVSRDASGRTVWEAETDGQKDVRYAEPDTTRSERLRAWLYGLLPIADQV